MKLSQKNLLILNLFDENKLLILKALYQCRDQICGCDLVQELNIPKNLVSYHIKKLRESGYVEESRCGKHKIYQITPSKVKKIQQILQTIELI